MQAERAAAQEKVTPTVEALRELARHLPPELKPVAERIAREAEALRPEPATPAEAAKAALRELATLEEMVRALQEHPGAEELQALQEELAKQELTRAAAEQMQRGARTAAAQELEAAARKATEQPQAAAALQAGLERVATQRPLSEGMREAMKSGAAAAMRQLAGQLRQSPIAPSAPRTAGPPSARDLQRLQAALKNLQLGQAGERREPPGANAPGNPGPPALQMPAAQGENEGPALGQLPAMGQAGGEHDIGTPETPFGERQQAAKTDGELALRGAVGAQGEVVEQTRTASPEQARARRQYKELYETMAPAAEDAVGQEDIPLGSRLFIRRYFEAIRPRD